MRGQPAREGPTVVVGLGVTGRAVVDALVAHGDRDLVLVDDHPSGEIRRFAARHGFEVVGAPDRASSEQLVSSASRVVPTPGLPDAHPIMVAVRRAGTPVVSEFDLAAGWDARPLIAVTGTDGKTTVTTMVAEMLAASGRRVALAGNNDTPLVEAIADPAPELFVVEASSFRLAHSARFAPMVATWLNFAPDHLDVHAGMDVYEAAKASIFAHQAPDGVAITNADDPVVARYRGRGDAHHLTFSADHGDYRVEQGWVVTPDGARVVAVDDLSRRAPHDVANALAATATAHQAGADPRSIAGVLRSFKGLAHRAQVVAEHAGVRYVDDSKATVPHAVAAAIRGCERVVLIAGGHNKGLDLGVLVEVADRVRAVVAIGEAAGEIREVFERAGTPVVDAASMDEAVFAATSLAVGGDTVLLSPGCTSHDWYASFAERGDDFIRAVHALHSGAGAS